jgi:cell division cycle 14
LGVTAVVRLNKIHYDKTVFTNNKINHYEFYFGDGTIPEESIVERFLEVVATEKGRQSVVGG